MFTTPAELSLRLAQQRLSDDREKAGRRRLAKAVRGAGSIAEPNAEGSHR
jgi:hypothetical protein